MNTDNRPGNLPAPNEVLQALQEAGWLLEQDTETTLKNHAFHTTSSKAYIDPDEPNTSREIDVTGYREFYRHESLGYSIAARVIIECKQSTMPYVLIGRPQSNYDSARERKEEQYLYNRVQIGHINLGDGRRQLQVVGVRDYLGINDLDNAPWNDHFVATQMTRLDRKKTWQADNRGIFTSLTFPLAKALDHFRRESPTMGSTRVSVPPDVRGMKRADEWGVVCFYFPLVVTSSTLFTLDVTMDDRTPSIAPWAPMTREIQTRNIRGRFHIDVATYDHLDTYIKRRIIDFMQNIVGAAEADPLKFATWQDYSYNES
jgi:hypothetical protein